MSMKQVFYAASATQRTATAVFSVVVSRINHMFSWISMFSQIGCCNNSRQCHAKDVILKLRGYIGLYV